MTFIQRPDGTGLVRDDFPENIARNASETEDWSTITHSSCVPAEIDSLFDWIMVKEMHHGTDPSRKYEVVHVPQPFPALGQGISVRRFTVRVFGIVGNCNVSQLGNWDRTVHGCTRAIQFVTLCPGAFVQQFEDQKASLHNIRCMVYRCLNEPMPRNQYRDTELFFHRRVFNVTNGYGPRPLISDSCTTDEDRLEAISGRWITAPPATYARKLVDGSLKRCNAMVISSGDFVDVTATVDIVSIGKNSRDKKTNIHFAFSRVVRLLSDQELTDLNGPQSTLAPEPEVPLLYEDKLPFEEDDWSPDEVDGDVVVQS